MASQPSSTPFDVNSTEYLQPPPGRRYVRSFLFSRRVDAPLGKVHLLARVLLVLSLSAAQLHTITTEHPDLAGAIVLWLVSLVLFVASGMHPRVARLYVLLTSPTLVALFISWLVLTPVPGHIVLFDQQVYAGYLDLALAPWEGLWLAIVVGYFCWRRGILVGILLASLVTFALTRFVHLPSWSFAHLPLFHPWTIYVSDQGVLLALTKVVGYSGMILATVALVVTSRDTELTGALRQLHLPQVVIFFLGTVFRALNLAISDYETIYQAQIARAINARPRSFLRRIRDLGSIAVPMVAMMIRRSSEIGDALLARGYTLQQASRNYFETSPWRLIDWLLLVFSLLLFSIAFAPYPTLTALLLGGR